jgi:octaprenyl-diphosphate synthase
VHLPFELDPDSKRIFPNKQALFKKTLHSFKTLLTLLPIPTIIMPMKAKTHIPTLESIRRPVATALAQVEALLQDNDPHIRLALDVSTHVLEAGGKRLRPIVLLLVTGHLGYEGPFHIDLATAIELVHTATLLHDDVVDDSPLRRGRPTAKQIWGNPASVLVGDYLYSRSFGLLAGCENIAVTQCMANATRTLAQGELMQLAQRGNLNLTIEEHMTILSEKTGKLFEVAAVMAGIIAGANHSTLDALAAYGMQLGIGFQLIDDVLDYQGNTDTLGKRLGDDFSDGSLTLPLIYALEHGTPAQKDFIANAIRGGNEQDLPDIQDILNKTGALTYSRALAQQYILQAISAIEAFPDTIHRQGMIDLAHYAISRSY